MKNILTIFAVVLVIAMVSYLLFTTLTAKKSTEEGVTSLGGNESKKPVSIIPQEKDSTELPPSTPK